MGEPTFRFDNSYARSLEGFFVPWKGDEVPAPKILRLNRDLAGELGLDADALDSAAGAAILAGAVQPDGAAPLAMAYAGHQFGGFSPQLGDGRALLIGEVFDAEGQRRDIHLKGSGRTPFSRGGDGKAVLGPVLREYLIGEAMHGLGVPTTRALAAVTTGEDIMREGPKPGAVLARVASSHLRGGTFQFCAARRETDKIRQLADYAIERHYPELAGWSDRYIQLLRQVRDRQAALIAKWMHVGFVHGVMNTDNMTISGETIDYGPCAFIDAFDPKAVFSSIDQYGRYAYGNQPTIAQWNLARFAEAILDLIDADDPDDAARLATEEINGFPAVYQEEWLGGMRAKLGLGAARDGDLELVNDLLALMADNDVDFTLFFRSLSRVSQTETEAVDLKVPNVGAEFAPWFERYRERLRAGDMDDGARAAAMDAVNPVYIPRNHLVEGALQAAENGDMAPFDRLLDALSDPYRERVGFSDLAGPAPDGFGPYMTFCGT